jgi:alkaline phosphatase
MHRRRPTTLIAVLLVFPLAALAAPTPGNVVFFHPDGTGLNQWTAARALHAGPDGLLAWDRLPEMAPYRGHMLDEIAGTSNGGATTHGFGFKVDARGSFGRDGDGTRTPPTDRPILALSGYPGSLMREAANAGHPTGLVNDGHIAEPGTGAFAAEVGDRDDWSGIVLEILAGRAHAKHGDGSGDVPPVVILGGGERDFMTEGLRRCAPREAARKLQRGLRTYPLDCRVHGLDWSEPVATEGVPGIGHVARGRRDDGRNLLLEASRAGYFVVRTRAEFDALRARLAADPAFRPKVLGLFAAHHTFNDRNEEELVAKGFIRGTGEDASLVLFGTPDPGDPGFDPPRIEEMTALAITVLDRHADASGKPWFLVSEPESTDNFGNGNNAAGTFAALDRADAAIGVVLERIARDDARPTTILVAADSDASGLQIVPVPAGTASVPAVEVNPAFGREPAVTPLDGIRGHGSPPFMAAPDAQGVRLPFAVSWGLARNDVAGGILARAASSRDRFDGKSAERPQHAPARDDLGAFSTRFDNTDVYRFLYAHLFGRWLPRTEAPAPTREAPSRKAGKH